MSMTDEQYKDWLSGLLKARYENNGDYDFEKSFETYNKLSTSRKVHCDFYNTFLDIDPELVRVSIMGENSFITGMVGLCYKVWVEAVKVKTTEVTEASHDLVLEVMKILDLDFENHGEEINEFMQFALSKKDMPKNVRNEFIRDWLDRKKKEWNP